MRPSIKDIRHALAAQLEGIAGLAIYPSVADGINPPCAVIAVAKAGIDYLQVYRSANADIHLEIIVLTGRANEVAGQDLLHDLITPEGPLSIPAALRLDDTLGGLVNYAVAQRATGDGRFTVGGIDYLGSRIDVEVNV